MRELQYTAKFNGSIEDNLKSYGFSTRICSLLKKEFGLVTVNGKIRFVVDYVNSGDVISIIIKDKEQTRITPYEFPIEIIFEDEDIAVVNKPPNIAVISTSAHYNNSLMNALATVWGDFVYHPVTRLDKGTSGLMLIAKYSLSHSLLNSNIANETGGAIGDKTVKREYLCLVTGLKDSNGIIDAPIAHNDKTSYRRSVDFDCGKRALTEYSAIGSYEDISLVRVKLFTGRTHQIRVHMSYIGCPLLGDELYGGDTRLISRPALHSCRLEFTHPINQKLMTFNADMPEDMQVICARSNISVSK